MRKLLTILLSLTAISAIAYYAVPSGSTVALPGSTTSVTMQWRRSGTDSLRQHWANDGTGWNRYYSATEINSFGLLSTASTIATSQLSANTISGIALGSNLANLAATNSTLTFSGTYNGSAARTIAINLANANTWTATQTFSAATTPLIYNSAASTAYSIIYQQNGANKVATGLTAGGNMATYYYPDGITSTSAYTTNAVTGVTTYQVAPAVPTQSANDNSTKAASTAYVDNALLNTARGRVVMSANVTGILNYDYLNSTTNQYTLTPPATAGFATDGSKIITALNTGIGSIKIICPSGYTILTPSGNVTPVTGSATVNQGQKIQLIPHTGTNTYYLQPLNGTITVL